MKWRTCVLLFGIVSGIVSGYSVWFVARSGIFIRQSWEPEYDPRFPRAFPFPDHFVLWCEDYYTEKYGDRLTGLDRMLSTWQLTFKVSSGAFVGLMMIWAVSISVKRTRVGICKACQYDLRGSPDKPGSTCPECGAIISQPATVES